MSVLASVLAYYKSFYPGSKLIDGGELKDLANRVAATRTGIVALAGGGQSAAAPQLSLGWNSVDTCATNSDSVMLPPAIPGSVIGVYNNTANTLAVFGQGPNMGGLAAGDTIAATNSNTQQATATGVTQATTTVMYYVCFVTGAWKQASMA